MTWRQDTHARAHVDVAQANVLCVPQGRRGCSRVCEGVYSHCALLDGKLVSFVTGADQSGGGRVDKGYVDALRAVLRTDDLGQALGSRLAQQLACNKETHYIAFSDDNTNIAAIAETLMCLLNMPV